MEVSNLNLPKSEESAAVTGGRFARVTAHPVISGVLIVVILAVGASGIKWLRSSKSAADIAAARPFWVGSTQSFDVPSAEDLPDVTYFLGSDLPTFTPRTLAQNAVRVNPDLAAR